MHVQDPLDPKVEYGPWQPPKLEALKRWKKPGQQEGYVILDYCTQARRALMNPLPPKAATPGSHQPVHEALDALEQEAQEALNS